MDLVGRHNQLNALAAIAAAEHVGVPVEVSLEALQTFSGVKRRMEVRGVENNITIIDDFAHHPTAIAETLLALRTKIGREHRILVVIEPRSNTMKMGTMKDLLAPSLSEAEEVICFAPPTLGWDVKASLSSLGSKAHVLNCLDDVVSCTVALAQPGDYVLVMSNGGFGGIHDKLLVALKGS
mgnify:FL=1